jgi:hypothetical protein
VRYRALRAIFLVLALAAPSVAFAAEAQLMVPIQKFIDSFNKGDAAGAAATHSASDNLTITDEVPPFSWRGAKAFSAWAADLESDSKKRGITDQMVTISAATREETNGQQAYVVVPAVYTFKEKGVGMREAAQMTFVLKKGAAGWRIHGWTWTGPRPTAAK